MSFLAPAAFGLLLLVPIIILMYLLKLRRTDQVVSSVYLWRRMVRDLEANAPWQRLRRNLLLLLQILFVLLMVASLARPFVWSQGSSGQAAILIVDVSASMAAVDTPPSRMDAAREQAHRLVDGLPDSARATVIAAGDGAQVLVSSSQDRLEIHRAIDRLQAIAGKSDLTAALELASAVAARQPETDILILSDGGVALPERLALRGRVSYYPIGISGENQAVSLLSVGLPPGGGTLTVFAQVSNYTPQESLQGGSQTNRRLTIFADERLVAAYDLAVSPNSQQAVLATGIPTSTQVIRAELGGQDALPLDDVAWTVYRPAQRRDITLVSDGNLFLETALRLLPGVEVSSIRPRAWETAAESPGESGLEAGAGGSAAALTIFDGYTPLTATLPAGNLLFIAPPRSTEFFTVTGTINAPRLILAGSDEMLLENMGSLQQVSVLDAVSVTMLPWARPLLLGEVDGERSPLLLAGSLDGRRIALLGFDVRRSDLPLQVSFPLLVANLVDWLAPGGAGAVPASLAVGEALSLALPPQAGSIQIIAPDGAVTLLPQEEGRVLFSGTSQTGVYRLSWEQPDGALEVPFAVNLFAPQESSVLPAGSLPLSGSEAQGDVQADGRARQELWRGLALLALVVLVLEWMVYQRAVLNRWLRRLKSTLQARVQT